MDPSSPLDVPPAKEPRTKLIVAVSVLILFAAVGLAYYYQKNQLKQEKESETAREITSDETVISEPETLANGWKEYTDKKRGYSITFPPDVYVYQPEEMAGNFIFCDQPLEDVKQAIRLELEEESVELIDKGCISSVVLAGAPEFTLDSLSSSELFPPKKNLSKEKETTLKEKQKITLGSREFSRIIYWTDVGKGGTYNYVTLLKGNKPLWFIFSYNDHTVRNERFVPQIEAILATIQEQ